MEPHPRFQAEYFIREFTEQLNTYSKVFHERVVSAFENLNEEAERVQNDEYSRLASTYSGEEDDSGISEMAYFKGVDFYLAVDEIRQGIVNLMVAGLYHLFEQHADTLAREMSFARQVPQARTALERIKRVVLEKGPDITVFKTYPVIDELRLVANTIKHGDGISATELRACNPNLFQDQPSLFPSHPMPLRPLVGEGLRLDDKHFNTYQANLVAFWHELTDALLPIFCPPNNNPAK